MDYYKLPENSTGFDRVCYNITEHGDALILWFNSDINSEITPIVLTDSTIVQFMTGFVINYRALNNE